MKNKVIPFLCAVLLAGCTTHIIPAGPDTYRVSTYYDFTSGGAQNATYKAANEFCAKRGLVMVPVSSDSREGICGQRPPTADLVFRALPPGDPEIKRPSIDKPDSIQRIQYR